MTHPIGPTDRMPNADTVSGSQPAATPPGPDTGFWQARFESRTTPWDRGESNPQLETWIRTGKLKPSSSAEARSAGLDDPRLTRVLVPGCGSGHEVATLAEWGFDVTGIDYAPAAIERTRARLRSLLQSPDATHVNRAEVLEIDVLRYDPPVLFDAVYEQTCLCALYPDLWRAYADRLHGWLKPGGKLFALFTQVTRPSSGAGIIEGPPYHCDVNAMRALFPVARWDWPRPPYPSVDHPNGSHELALILTRR